MLWAMKGAMDTVAPPAGLTRESVIITETRGPMTHQVRDAVLRKGGEEAWQALLAKVSEPCRETFSKPIGPYEWIPAQHSKELSLAYMEGADPAFSLQRGRDTAKELLTVMNRWMLRLMSPAFFLQSAPRMFGFYYRGGRLVVDRIESSSASLSLWADAFYPAWFEGAVPGWLEGALELTGARLPAVRHLPPDGEGLAAFRHGYEVRWEA
jgi:hypothetical protein